MNRIHNLLTKSDLDIRIQKKVTAAAGTLVLQLQLSAQAGERIAILGPSGSGKTTLLKMLAGLVKPDAGHIIFNNQVWFDSNQKINRAPQRRRVGLMFQEYALFPNMTVQQNLKYASQGIHSQMIIDELVETVELGELIHRYPGTLSGGQQQRVALARALAAQPQLLLLDEPLSALDADMRERLQQYILTVQKKYQLTSIWVTHNREEACKIAQQVLRLDNGVLQEQPLQKMPIEISGVVRSTQNDGNQQTIVVDLNTNEIKFTPQEKITIIKS